MGGLLRRAFLVLACTLVAATAGAQGLASIVGVVKDASGAVLPGVTVEASSPALLEKVRTAVTDGAGNYQIISLLPGAYTVTFTLTGFQTVKREGIVLTGSLAASVNVDMVVGQVAETITVTGETPLVDVQSANVQNVITKEVIDSIPTPRLGISLAALIPGMVTFNGNGVGRPGQAQRASLTDQDVGGQNGDVFTDLSIHGSRPGDMKTMWNGLSVATTIRFGESTSSAPSMIAFQEVAIVTSGGDATVNAGGVRLNYAPRDGGNTFRGFSFLSFGTQDMRASNYTDELEAAGMPPVGDLKRVYDINPGGGGPIVRDKLWFFFSAHWIKAENYITGNFPNLNAGNPALWTYAPDTAAGLNFSPGFGGNFREQTLRVAWQANAKSKFGFYWANKYRCQCLAPGATTSLEARTNAFVFYPFSDQWLEWTSPVSSRLLLEAGIFHHQETWGNTPAPTNLVNPNAIGMFDLVPPAGQTIQFYHGVFGNNATPSHNPNTRARFAVSYITGSHVLKAGFDDSWAKREAYSMSSTPYGLLSILGPNAGVYLVSVNSNTSPNPIYTSQRVKADGGLFVQDKWTSGRLTLQAGLRFDWFSGYLPEQTVGPSINTPNRNLTIPRFQTLSWKDITPKFGAAYDLTGDGKTALKVSIGKYVLGQAFFGNGLLETGPASVVTTDVRTFIDFNGDHIPNCNFQNFLPNGECLQGNPAFGSTVPVSTADEDIRFGWGKRQYDWEFAVSAQRELTRAISMNGGFYRRWYGNFYVTDNINVPASEYQEYSLTAPTSATIPKAALLPGGGGYPVNGLFMISQAGFATIANNFQTFSSNYGKQTDHWNGFDVGINVKGARGLLLQGGVSTGKQTLDNCDVVDDVPESLFQQVDFFGTFQWQPKATCHLEYPWLTQVKFLAGYTLPKIDVQIGATLQNIPGYERVSAIWQAPNSQIAAAIGRPVPGGAPTGTTAINVVTPGTIYGDRLNQLDLRFGKVLRFGNTRSVVSADIFNVFNVSTVTNESRNLTTWQQPSAIIGARLLKISWQIDF
jgi:hypothetical protein